MWASSSQHSDLVDKLVHAVLYIGLVFVVAVSLLTLPFNPGSPWKVAGTTREVSDLLRYTASHARLERIEQAIQVYYLDSGIYPRTLQSLAENGYIRAADLFDPWGRDYGFQLSSGGYQLFGGDSTGEVTPELSISHEFSAAQRMMMDARADVDGRVRI